MKIKKGLKYVCVKKIKLDEVFIFKKGFIYTSRIKGQLIDNHNCDRYIVSHHIKHFIELK